MIDAILFNVALLVFLWLGYRRWLVSAGLV
jgi:hypothetical protein